MANLPLSRLLARLNPERAAAEELAARPARPLSGMLAKLIQERAAAEELAAKPSTAGWRASPRSWGKLDLPEEYEPAPAQEAAPGKFNWKQALSRGLTGAAYAMQASAGAPVAGQEWAQGLIKGVSGLGMAQAAEAAQAERRREREELQAGKLALLRGREAARAAEPGWEEKFRKTEAGKMERLQESLGVARERMEAAKAANIKSAKSDEEKNVWEGAWRDAAKSFSPYEVYQSGYNIKVSDEAQRLHDIRWAQLKGEKPPRQEIQGRLPPLPPKK